MKAIWNGSLAFGLINIPVRVYSGSEERSIQFHMLHKKDLSPIRFARICKADDKEVSYKDIVKGYEYEKEHYIVIEEDELKKINPQKSSTVEIHYFADVSEIDILYYEKPYFLEPEKKAGKSYALLRDALKRSEKVALVSYVFHGKEHIGAIFPSEDALILMQMRYQNELRSLNELTIPEEKISDKELTVALSFIDHLTENFDPKQHHDTYAEDVMQLIQSKLKGKKIISDKRQKVIPIHEAQDLLGLLQESLKQTPKKKTSKSSKKSNVPPSRKTRKAQ